MRFLGYTLGVGFLEELVKALPLIFIVKQAREPLIPQTMVFYGLISGIAFGVFEGVGYQMNVNNTLDYHNAFFMNVARLTSLPFLHAIWCGIAGYFIAFAELYPKYRLSLFLLAIAIPALLHGLYDTFGWSLIGLFITVLGVILLTNYLKKGVDYQSKLRE
jgi:RsiW-degrading membrane proteinase PrsW (M82 family)